ncbi:MAG: histidinol-phosphatase [Nitrospirae bacterium]|nr:MAG: histidinol-phosphatase [Nitrospirota bacterium]
MSMDTNQCLANLFLAMGELLAMQGANPHRVRAYRRAAETIFNLPVPIHTIAQRGELQALPSIGKDLAAKIQEFLTTGTIQAYEKLKTPLPPQVREWAKLPGFSEPLVHDLFYRLGITTLDDLERLVRSHLLRTRLRHSGSTQEVLEAIQALRHRHHQPI